MKHSVILSIHMVCYFIFLFFTASKWTDDDIEMLQSAVKKFTDDLAIICDQIKQRTV